MLESIVLFFIGLFWIFFAVVSDLKTREIPNWLNFSLIIFVLGFRFFYSLFEKGSFEIFSLILTFFVGGFVLIFVSSDFGNKFKELSSFFTISLVFILILFNFSFFSDATSNFLLSGLGGLMVFFILGNLFYYSKMFAYGDAKLMISLGVLLPIYSGFFLNFGILVFFILIFLIVGTIYSIFFVIYSGLKNFSNLKKQFKKQFKKNKKYVSFSLFFASSFLIFSFFIPEFFYLGLIFFIFPYFYLYLKSVDKVCMIKDVLVSKLTLGDWLYEDIKIGNKVVKATWDGLGEKDLEILKKNKKKVLVRYGIQFAPVFLVSFLLFWIFIKIGFLEIFFKFF